MNDTLKLCYWLQGFAEINGKAPTKKQWKEIRKRIEEDEGVDEGAGGLMPAGNFISWIKGFIEIANPDSVSASQWNVIKEHLQLVFTKVTTETVEDDNSFQDLLEDIKKKQDENRNPWKYPDPDVTPWPFDPNRVICSNENNLNKLDVACNEVKRKPKRLCSTGGTTGHMDPSKITYCLNANNAARAVYEADPVN